MQQGFVRKQSVVTKVQQGFAREQSAVTKMYWLKCIKKQRKDVLLLTISDGKSESETHSCIHQPQMPKSQFGKPSQLFAKAKSNHR